MDEFGDVLAEMYAQSSRPNRASGCPIRHEPGNAALLRSTDVVVLATDGQVHVWSGAHTLPYQVSQPSPSP